MSEPRYCTRCKFVGVHRIDSEVSSAQWAALVFWLLLLVLPGLIYAIHLATGGGSRRFYVCPKCGARRMSVPLDTPIAQAEVAPPVVAAAIARSGHSAMYSLGRLFRGRVN